MRNLRLQGNRGLGGFTMMVRNVLAGYFQPPEQIYRRRKVDGVVRWFADLENIDPVYAWLEATVEDARMRTAGEHSSPE